MSKFLENDNNLVPLDAEDRDTWWRTIPGARRFLNIAYEAFDKKNAVALHLPVDPEGFVSALELKIRRKSASSLVERFSYTLGGDVENFVDALKRKFAPDFVRNLMRAPLEDLAIQNPFKGYAAIIVTLENEAPWLPDAVRDFNRKAKNFSTALIFVTTEENPPPNITRLSDYLTPYDVQFFAMNFLETAALSARKKMYTAALAEKLSARKPLLVKNLARAELYSYGFEFVLTILPHFDERIYRRAVWECQVQFLLPTLERIREWLIQKCAPLLCDILPKQDEFGTFLSEPFDMELRHLFYYGGRQHVFQQDDWALLELAYNARNDLSHLKTIELWELERLFAFDE